MPRTTQFSTLRALPFNNRIGRSSEKIWSYFVRYEKSWFKDEEETELVRKTIIAKCVFCGVERSGNLHSLSNHLYYQCDVAPEAAKEAAFAFRQRRKRRCRREEEEKRVEETATTTTEPALSLPSLSQESVASNSSNNERDNNHNRNRICVRNMDNDIFEGVVKTSRQRPAVIASPVLATTPVFSLPLTQRPDQNICVDIDRKISEWIFFNNHSFDIVEQDEFKEIFRSILPGYQLPSRKTIGNRLLTECYERTKKQVHKV